MLLGAAVVPSIAHASPITDAPNDFIPSFLGPHNGDLDVLKAEVLLDSSNFTLHAVVNGAVGTTSGGFYVWGFNRGAGTQGFPTIAPGVLFDRVVVLNSNGTSNIAGASVQISGNEIFGIIPRSALPSTDSARFWTHWTPQEDELVRTLPPAQAAAHTGRTIAAVYQRRRRLGE